MSNTKDIPSDPSASTQVGSGVDVQRLVRPWSDQEVRDLRHYVEDAWNWQWPGWDAIKLLMATESHPTRSASAYRQKYDRIMKANVERDDSE